MSLESNTSLLNELLELTQDLSTIITSATDIEEGSESNLPNGSLYIVYKEE